MQSARLGDIRWWRYCAKANDIGRSKLDGAVAAIGKLLEACGKLLHGCGLFLENMVAVTLFFETIQTKKTIDIMRFVWWLGSHGEAANDVLSSVWLQILLAFNVNYAVCYFICMFSIVIWKVVAGGSWGAGWCPIYVEFVSWLLLHRI